MNVEQRRIQCWDIDAGYAAAHERYKLARSVWRFPDLAIKGYQEVGAFKCLSRLTGFLDGETYIVAAGISDLRNVFWHVFTTVKPLLHEYFQSEFAPAFCSMLKQGVETFGPKNGINEYLGVRPIAANTNNSTIGPE